MGDTRVMSNGMVGKTRNSVRGIPRRADLVRQRSSFLPHLFRVGKNGVSPLDNIFFLRLFVELIEFLSVEDARSFRYQEQTLLWWYVLWKICGERILRTCGGMKPLGTLVGEDSRRTPHSAALINFIERAEESEAAGCRIPPRRTPYIFEEVLAFSKDPAICYNLQFDGKLVKKGLTEHHGDIDCLGEDKSAPLCECHEEHDTLLSLMEDFTDSIASVQQNCRHANDIPLPDSRQNLAETFFST